MGVHGLWKLIEPSGQMVPLESLAGKVLAVDVSIWLHQAVKGMHDAQGAPLAVAHLLVLFHRVCKLLYYKIKPVFVFDGGVPALKHQTMVARRQRSSSAKNEVMKVREKLIKNLLKHEAVRSMLSDEAASAALGLNSFTLPGPSIEEDLYKLPPIAADYADSECSDSTNPSDEETGKHVEDIHSIDVTSKEFLSLPAEVRHDILTELIETRKQSSWKHLDSMPKKSDSFSDFQMSRLLKRHAVQTSLEKAGKEMGGRALSLKELESLLGDQGVLDSKTDLPSRRIAQDSVTRYMLVQKDNSEGVLEQQKSESFDIMNHLEDVEWSSESDTDVILQKNSTRQKRPDSTKKIEETSGRVEDKQKESLVSKKTKVEVVEEVADILSILEDNDTKEEEKVKAEDSSSCKYSSESNLEELKVTQSRTIENTIEEKSMPNLKEEIQDTSTEAAEVVETEVVKAEPVSAEVVSDSTNPTTVPNVESEKPCKEINEEKVSIVEETKEIKETENKIEPLSQTIPKESINSEDDKKAIDSSSDSEDGFVPIENENSKIVSQDNEKNQEKPSEPMDHKSDSLTVVIKPSELNQTDDLFADVFNPVPDEGKTLKESEDTYKLDPEFEEQLASSDINLIKKNLEEQHTDLMREKGKQERLTLNMNDQIYADAQELLRLFGIPFVVAPMEAEAQCATLNILGLTEGTITDDSDIWLFGGLVVYKNFFNQQKHVLEYRSENIQKYYKLTREEMIKMAMLVGSDYTVGLNGVGPVTALEIIAAFQTPNQGLLDGLQKFRDWFLGSASSGPVRATLRKKIKNLIISPGFPNRAVAEAYLNPQVDDSKESFSWAKPNVTLIKDYVRTRLGWSNDKCNELLLPVLKKLEENSSQSTIDRHFRIVHKSTPTEGLLSKRVESAIKRLGNSSLEHDEPPDEPKPKKKRKRNTSKPTASTESDEDSKKVSKPASKPRPSRSKELNTEPPTFKTESSTSSRDETSKVKLINQKLHQDVKVPQKEMAQKLLEEKKKEAIKIFRTFKKGGRKKTKVYAKEQVKLSESSSEDD